MNNLTSYTGYLNTKLGLLPSITTPLPPPTGFTRIAWSELAGKEIHEDGVFPRIEVAYHGDDNYKYVGQNNLSPIYWFSICGYIRWVDETNDTNSFERILKLSDFYHEVKQAVMDAHSDKLKGITIYKGFERIHNIMHCNLLHEVIPRMSAFVFVYATEGSQDWNKINY